MWSINHKVIKVVDWQHFRKYGRTTTFSQMWSFAHLISQFRTENGVSRWGSAGQVGFLKNEFYREFDRERLSGKSSGEDYRSTFQIDRDRVLHTPTFRSLQSKTQVFWSGEYDFYRTRLTHSLEVAQIGRGICDWLQKSSEVLADGLRLMLIWLRPFVFPTTWGIRLLVMRGSGR